MKSLIVILLVIFSHGVFAQQPSLKTWQKQAKKDIRMLPEFGNMEKTKQEIEADTRFVNSIIEGGKSKSEGAHEMIRIGFDYLYKGDLKTAMYRFNQAYLLNPKNSGIYWGYGAVYTAMGAFDEARSEYKDGLKLEPKSAPILTDFATTYLGEYYANVRSNYKSAQKSLKMAKEKLLASYAIDPQYIHTTYKLSIVYLNSQDCSNAKKYLKETRALGGQPITKGFLTDFNLRCGDCSNVKTGNFQIQSRRNGITKIVRNKNYQIEENEAINYKLKLKVDWLDECTYTLTPVENLSTKQNDLPKMILTCQIIEVNEGNYIQVSTSDDSERPLTSQIDIVQ
ncbi:MAG: tetratricopeptide repeat protein [Maribacter sp.]